MKLSCRIRFVNRNLQEEFYALKKGNSFDQELFKVINTAFDNIEDNAFCGIQIPKKLIPKFYFKKYSVKNVWKYNLPDGLRLIYSISKDELNVVAIILEWMNHKNYEKRFNY